MFKEKDMQQWDDTNRFSQTGYSAPTLRPQKENYTNLNAYTEDFAKAERREQSHQEWLEEERRDARESAYHEWLEEE